MAIVQLNFQIKKDFAMDYYSMIKFCEKCCSEYNNTVFHHLEVNIGYSIYNVFTLYNVTPYVVIKSGDIISKDPKCLNSLLILMDSRNQRVLHITEFLGSGFNFDIDKYVSVLLEKYLNVDFDSKKEFNKFINKSLTCSNIGNQFSLNNYSINSDNYQQNNDIHNMNQQNNIVQLKPIEHADPVDPIPTYSGSISFYSPSYFSPQSDYKILQNSQQLSSDNCDCCIDKTEEKEEKIVNNLINSLDSNNSSNSENK